MHSMFQETSKMANHVDDLFGDELRLDEFGFVSLGCRQESKRSLCSGDGCPNSIFDTKEMPQMLDELVGCQELQILPDIRIPEPDLILQESRPQPKKRPLPQRPIQKPVRSFTGSQHMPDDAKNLLTNMGTALKNYMKQVCTEEELELFNRIFGSRKIYKGLNRFSDLFGSKLQPLCVEFFNKYVLRMIITSKASRKSGMIKFLGVLRQGAIRGKIHNLTHS